MFFHFPNLKRIFGAIALTLGLTGGLQAVTVTTGWTWHPVETKQNRECANKTYDKVLSVTIMSSETGSDAGIALSNITFDPKPTSWVAQPTSSSAFPDAITIVANYPESAEGIVSMKYLASFPQDNPVPDGVTWTLPVGPCRTPAKLTASASFTCVAIEVTVSNTGETSGTASIATSSKPGTGGSEDIVVPAGKSVTKVISNPAGHVVVTTGSTVLLDRDFAGQLTACNPPKPVEIITSVVETKVIPPTPAGFGLRTN